MFLRPVLKLLPVIFLVIFLIIIALSWFKPGLFISGGDEYWMLNPTALKRIHQFAWSADFYNGGAPDIYLSQVFPITYFWQIFNWLHVPSVIIQKIWIVLLFILPALSIYYFFQSFFNPIFYAPAKVEWDKLEESHYKSIKIPPWAGAIAGLLYTCNIFITIAGPFQNNLKLVLIALPLMLLFFWKGLKKKQYLKYAILTSLCSIIFAQSNINIPAVTPIPIILFLFLLFYFLFHHREIKGILKFTILTATFYLLFNIWWLAPFIVNYFLINTSLVKSTGFWNVMSSSQLLDIFRFLGFWGWKSVHYLRPYYSFAPAYDHPFFLVSTYSIPFLCFLVLVLGSLIYNKKILFFVILGLEGLFLAKGSNPVLGNIYQFFFRRIPGFWIFREPFTKFTPIIIFSFSVLLPISIFYLYYIFKKNVRFQKIAFLVPLIVITLILTNAYPLWKGQFIWQYWNGSMRTLYTQIPSYWKEANQFLKSQNKGRIFNTPLASYGTPYNWEYGFSSGDNIAVILLKNSVLRYIPNPISSSDKIVDIIFDEFWRQDINIPRLLGLFNTKFILQQNDIDWRYIIKSMPPSKMQEKLLSQEGIKFVKSFGILDIEKIPNPEPDPIKARELQTELINRTGLDLYCLEDKYYTPKIYASNYLTAISGNERALIDLTNNPDLVWPQTIVFLNESRPIFLKKDMIKNNAIRIEIGAGEQKNIVDNKGWETSRDGFFIAEKIGYSDNFLVYKFDIPLEATYNFYINFKERGGAKKLNYEIDQEGWREFKNPTPENLHENSIAVKVDQLFLEKGEHYLTLQDNEPPRNMTEDDKKWEINFAYFYTETTLDPNFLPNNNLPELEFQKINPTKYFIKIKNAQAPFFLNFLETHNFLWKAYMIEDGSQDAKAESIWSTWFREPLPDNTHFLINGYANGWLLDQKGNYNIILEYWPQRLFYLSKMITLLSVLGGIIYLIKISLKKK